jgi:hypothetical protein
MLINQLFYESKPEKFYLLVVFDKHNKTNSTTLCLSLKEGYEFYYAKKLQDNFSRYEGYIINLRDFDKRHYIKLS